MNHGFIIIILRNVYYLAGFVQFVTDSCGVAEILNTDGSILNFLRKHNPSENAPFGIAPEAMDNYVKSCGKLTSLYVTSLKVKRRY